MPTTSSGSGAGAGLLGWHVETNVWNPAGLIYGTDYTTSVTYDPANLDDHPTWNWHFPAATSSNYYTVHSYAEIMYGGSPWWDAATSAEPMVVFPLAVASLTSLNINYDVSIGGNTDGFNVAFEIWLESTNGSGSANLTNEIMVWFHHGAMTPGGTPAGTFSSGAYSGAIYNSGNWSSGWNYTAYMNDTDILSGSFDLAALLAKLKTMGIITGTEYIYGLEFGTEVETGTGSWTANKLEYDIQQTNGVTTIIGGTTGTAGSDRMAGSNDAETLSGLGGTDQLYGYGGNDTLNGGDEHDTLNGGAGNDTLDGGSNVDIAVFAGNRTAYSITQGATGVFTVSGSDGTDTLTNVEYAKFNDQTVRLLPGSGTTINWSADSSTYMTAIRDFDGNDLGAATGWKLIGTADVNGDGTAEHILVNRQNGRWAEVGTEADGKTYFANNGWAGDTRVVGIYIDPLVTSGEVVAGSDFDSQRRFQNDLYIDNIHGVLGQNDYNHDGLQEIYFSLTDGTAYLHAYMHADGNIQYANYQNEQQVKDYLTSNGFTSAVWAGWFPAAQTAPERLAPDSFAGQTIVPRTFLTLATGTG